MLIDNKTYTSINVGLVNMRRNVIAIRKTLLSNRKLGKQIDTKIKLQDQQLKETQNRAEVEREREKKRSVRISLPKLSLLNPERAFSILGSNPVASVVTFFSFALVGWMLKALPALQNAITSFIEKAQSFLNSLTQFWDNIKNFFVGIFRQLGIVYETLISGVDFFVPGTKKSVEDKFRELTNSIKDLITGIPKRVVKFITDLLSLNVKVTQRVKNGQTAEEALREETNERFELPPLLESPLQQENRVRAAAIGSSKFISPAGTVDNYFAPQLVPDLKVSEKTLGEIQQLLKSNTITGAGAWAIDKDTLDYLLASGTFKTSDIFNSEIQSQMWKYLTIIKLAGVRNYLKTPTSNDPNKEQKLASVAITQIITELPLLLNYADSPAQGRDLLLQLLEEYKKQYQDYLKTRVSSGGYKFASLINNAASVQTIALGNGRSTKIVNVNAEIPIPNSMKRRMAASLNKSNGSYSGSAPTVIRNYPLSDTPYTSSLFA